MKDTVIVVMAKQPRPGYTKTRLCPPLLPGEAAALAEALLRDTIVLAAGLPEADLAIAITPAGARAYFEEITPPGTRLLPVAGTDIGACLVQALADLLERGYRRVLALNADGPTLPCEYLQQAVHLLEESELVLGPGHDGGYYLVGMKALHARLFQSIPWSTGQVLARTLERAGALGLRAALTPEWYDVDTPADLLRLWRDLDALPASRLAHTRRFLGKLKTSEGSR